MKPNTLNLYYLKKTYNGTFAYKQRNETYFHDSYTLSNVKFALANNEFYYYKGCLEHLDRFLNALKVGTEIPVNTKCRDLGEYL